MTPESTIKTYRGFIQDTSYSDYEVLSLGDGPLVEKIEGDVGAHGNYLTVRYFISDKEIPEDQVVESFSKTLYGAADASLVPCYGTSWTGCYAVDEVWKVGGHDMVEELSSHKGKFCHLEITFNSSPPA